MTTISAKIIADSISPAGKRLTTMQLRYPLVIHAESKTHRILSESGETEFDHWTPGVMNDPNLSRNARSSRAVPVERMIQECIDDPFVPLHWGKAQPGMQAYEECDSRVDIGSAIRWHRSEKVERKFAWLLARDSAVAFAKSFHEAGYAKQVVNRLLAPFLHIDTLVTATEWDNFFELRLHHAAEPHMRMLAEAMKEAMGESTPKLLQPGEWHLPYINENDVRVGRILYGGENDISTLRKISAARCARISYAPFDGNGSTDAELARYESLVGSKPIHASPVEHQATPDEIVEGGDADEWEQPGLHRNFIGWIQNRALIEKGLA